MPLYDWGPTPGAAPASSSSVPFHENIGGSSMPAGPAAPLPGVGKFDLAPSDLSAPSDVLAKAADSATGLVSGIAGLIGSIGIPGGPNIGGVAKIPADVLTGAAGLVGKGLGSLGSIPLGDPNGPNTPTLGHLAEVGLALAGAPEKAVERTVAGFRAENRVGLSAADERALAQGTPVATVADSMVARNAGFIDNPVANLVGQIVLDPTNYLSLGVGAVGKEALLGMKSAKAAQEIGVGAEVGQTMYQAVAHGLPEIGQHEADLLVQQAAYGVIDSVGSKSLASIRDGLGNVAPEYADGITRAFGLGAAQYPLAYAANMVKKDVQKGFRETSQATAAHARQALGDATVLAPRETRAGIMNLADRVAPTFVGMSVEERVAKATEWIANASGAPLDIAARVVPKNPDMQFMRTVDLMNYGGAGHSLQEAINAVPPSEMRAAHFGADLTVLGPRTLDTTRGEDLAKALAGEPVATKAATEAVAKAGDTLPKVEAVAPAADYARFGTTVPPSAPGRPPRPVIATMPTQFKSEPGYVYRTVNETRVTNDWKVGEFAAKHPATVYAADTKTAVVVRTKASSIFEDAKGGVNAGENVRSTAVIPVSQVEVLGADGVWRPATGGASGDAAEMASWVPRAARPAPAGAYDHMVANGGGTFDVVTGKEMGLKSGYSVGMGAQGKVVENTRAAVDAAYSEVSKTGAPHIGLWRNPVDNMVSVDPTEVVMDRAAAVTLGKARGEKAIYDHAAQADIVLANEPNVVAAAGKAAGGAAPVAVTPQAIALAEYAVAHFDQLSGLEGKLHGAALVKAVQERLAYFTREGTLPAGLRHAVTGTQHVPNALKEWAAKWDPLGYRIGFVPKDEMKVMTLKDGSQEFIQPFMRFASDALPLNEKAPLTRFMEGTTGPISYSKVVNSARIRYIYNSHEMGLAEYEANAMFRGVLDEAKKSMLAGRPSTPRGLGSKAYDQIAQQVLGAKRYQEYRQAGGDALLSVMDAFAGNWKEVGLTQKVSGEFKAMFRTQIPKITEEIYPMWRFGSPGFQYQEYVESPFLNALRGIKPVWTTKGAKDVMATAKRVYGDLIQSSDEARLFDGGEASLYLAGHETAKMAFGPGSKIGNMLGRVYPNVIDVKQANQLKQILVEHPQLFHETIVSHYGEQAWKIMEDAYGTKDLAQITEQFMAERIAFTHPGDWVDLAAQHKIAFLDPKGADMETVWNAFQASFAKSLDQAHTTHFFPSTRGWLARTINHPFLGLYPFSYMMKVGQEYARFMLIKPFGLDAPLLGYRAVARVQAAIITQQAQDPEGFGKFMIAHKELLYLLNILLPGLPTDLPANAPAIIRHQAANQVAGKPLSGPQIAKDIPLDTFQNMGYGRDVTVTAGALGNTMSDLGGILDNAAKMFDGQHTAP